MNHHQQQQLYQQHRNRSSSFSRRMSLPNHLDLLRPAAGSTEETTDLNTSPRMKPSKVVHPPPFAVIHSTKNLDTQKIFVPLETSQTNSDNSNDAITPASPRQVVMVQKKGNAFMSKFKLEKPKKMKSVTPIITTTNTINSSNVCSSSTAASEFSKVSPSTNHHSSTRSLINFEQQIPPPQVTYNPPTSSIRNSSNSQFSTSTALPSLQSVVESVVNDIMTTPSSNQVLTQQQIQFLMQPYKS